MKHETTEVQSSYSDLWTWLIDYLVSGLTISDTPPEETIITRNKPDEPYHAKQSPADDAAS